MISFIKKVKGLRETANSEDGFSLVEVVVSITLFSILSAMVSSCIISTVEFQNAFMKKSVGIEFQQAVNSVFSNRLINIDATEEQMLAMWDFNSDVNTIYYYSGSAVEWSLVGVNEPYGLCFMADADNPDMMEVDCDSVDF